MKNFSLAKSAVLMTAILAIGSVSITGCSSENDTKAVDRTEEAAAIARVQDLEARAEQLKTAMPAATDISDITVEGDASNAAKPSIKMPDIDSIPDDEYGAAVRRGLQIANHTYKEMPDNVGNQLNCTSCHLANGRKLTRHLGII